MHRFFLTGGPFHIGQRVDITLISKQLTSVLRAQPGDEITLLDGEGNASTASITSLSKNNSTARILEQYVVQTEPKTALTLYQCTLKADKFEWVLQKGTELGVTHFVPIISTRSIVRPASKVLQKYERWRRILQEAAEQSGRGRLPTLGEPLLFNAMLDIATGLKLLPWEEKSKEKNAALGDMIHDNMKRTAERDGVSLLIGSEGGFEANEIDAAHERGWQIVSLGPRILRAETAALAATAIVLDQLDEMG